MPTLTFTNLTLKQAKTLASWYEGQGEQDASIWFDEHNVPVPLAAVQRKDGYLETKGEDLILHTHTPK